MEVTQAVYANQKTSKRKIVVVALAVAVVVVAVAIGVVLTNRQADNQDPQASGPAAQIVIDSNSPAATTVQIKRGQSVLWLNQDDRPHTVSLNKAAENGDDAAAQQINQGEAYSFVFDEPGTFNYYD